VFELSLFVKISNYIPAYDLGNTEQHTNQQFPNKKNHFIMIIYNFPPFFKFVKETYCNLLKNHNRATKLNLVQ